MSLRFAFVPAGARLVVSLKDGAWAPGSRWGRGGHEAGLGGAAVTSLRRGFGRLRSGRPGQRQTSEAAVASGAPRVSPGCSVSPRTVGEAGVGLGTRARRSARTGWPGLRWTDPPDRPVRSQPLPRGLLCARTQ